MGQKIEYDDVTIGDDSAGLFIRITGREHERGVEQAEMFQAELPDAQPVVTIALGNLRNMVAFSVEKQHASEAAANAYLSDFPDSLAKQGVLKWTTGAGVRYLNDAALRGVRLIQLDGQTTILAFTFVGGAFTTS